MSYETTIYKQNVQMVDGYKQITLKEVVTFQNYYLTEEMSDYARLNTWFVSGESGMVFELLGSTIKENFLPLLLELSVKSRPNNILKDMFEDDEWYRVSVSC